MINMSDNTKIAYAIRLKELSETMWYFGSSDGIDEGLWDLAENSSLEH